jgi:hypothetical protein
MATTPASTPGSSKKRGAEAHPEARVQKRPNTNHEATQFDVQRAESPNSSSSDVQPEYNVSPEPQDDSNPGIEAKTGIAEIAIPVIERMLWIPNQNVGGIWLLQLQQPDELCAGITQKFDKDFLSTEYRKKIYHSTLRVKEKYVKWVLYQLASSWSEGTFL